MLPISCYRIKTKLFNRIFYELTNCLAARLMPLRKHVQGYGLDFFTGRHYFSPTGAFWHTTIHIMYVPWAHLSFFVFHFSLLTAQGGS